MYTFIVGTVAYLDHLGFGRMYFKPPPPIPKQQGDFMVLSGPVIDLQRSLGVARGYGIPLGRTWGVRVLPRKR